MSAYRIHTNIKNNIDTKLKFYNSMLNSLDALNEYLNKKFETDINQVKSRYFLSAALAYLKRNDVEDFKKYMELSFKMRKWKTFKYVVAFYLRHFPSLFNLS